MSRFSVLFLVAGIVPNGGYAYSCTDVFPRVQPVDVRGIAHDQDGKLAYIEEIAHHPNTTSGTLNVRYLSPDRSKLAIKTVHYNCKPISPDFMLIDLASGEVEGASIRDKRIISYRRGSSKELPLPGQPAIFDAGFDNFIKLNWESLISGESLTSNYLHIRNNRIVKLKLERSDTSPELENEADENVIFFRIHSSNLLLRFLASPVFVGYDIDSRSLRNFSGPSNLPMMSGLEKVLIRYEPLGEREIDDLITSLDGARP